MLRLLLLVVLSFSLAAANNNKKNCHYSQEWSSWSDCEYGFQTRTKTCECKNTPPPTDDYDPYSVDRRRNSGKNGDDDDDDKHGKGDNDDDHGKGDSDDDHGKGDNDDDHGKGDSDDDHGKGDSDDNHGKHGDDDDNSSHGDDDDNSSHGDDDDNGNDECEEGDSQTQIRDCCVWSEWSDFSDCSATCGGGDKTRTRECICGNGDDEPYTSEYSKRSVSDCLTDCKASCDNLCADSDKPFECLKPCIKDCRNLCKAGDDQPDRRRSSGYDDVVPQTCSGPSTDTVPCNDTPCSNCQWIFGEFTQWGACDKTCGGVRRRYADCECDPSEDYPVCAGEQPFEEENCQPCPAPKSY